MSFVRNLKRQLRYPLRPFLASALVCGLASLVLIGAVLYVGQQERLRANESLAAGYVPEALGAAAPTDRPTVVYVGDAYTAGAGASSESTRWVSLVSEERGWDTVNLARPLTGYVSTSQPVDCGFDSCPTFKDMLAEAKKYGPDVVVVAGGQDDFWEYNLDPERVGEETRTTLDGYRTAFPDAELIVVGPATPNGAGAIAQGLNDRLAVSAESAGATFVDLIDPPALSAPTTIPASAGLDDAGHAAIADRVLSTQTRRD